MSKWIELVTSAEEGGYVFGSVCLSVCLSDYSQTCERILTKFSVGVWHGSRTKWYNFGGDPDHASDPGVQSPKSGSSGLPCSAEVCSLWVHLVIGVMVTTYNSYFLLDGVWICSWKGRPPQTPVEFTRLSVKSTIESPASEQIFWLLLNYGWHSEQCWAVVKFITNIFAWDYFLSFNADTLRHISNGHLAALIAKGIDQFPENTDRLVGTIDIWWILRILEPVIFTYCYFVCIGVLYCGSLFYCGFERAQKYRVWNLCRSRHWWVFSP